MPQMRAWGAKIRSGTRGVTAKPAAKACSSTSNATMRCVESASTRFLPRASKARAVVRPSALPAGTLVWGSMLSRLNTCAAPDVSAEASHSLVAAKWETGASCSAMVATTSIRFASSSKTLPPLQAAMASSGAESGPQKRRARAGVWRISFGSLPSALTCSSARSRWNRRVPFMSLAATKEPSGEIADALRWRASCGPFKDMLTSSWASGAIDSEATMRTPSLPSLPDGGAWASGRALASSGLPRYHTSRCASLWHSSSRLSWATEATWKTGEKPLHSTGRPHLRALPGGCATAFLEAASRRPWTSNLPETPPDTKWPSCLSTARARTSWVWTNAEFRKTHLSSAPGT
mmetsp:Transcript_22962/g.59935  ORF Transcript_22962/g.59935 Transcript_22962/m.59935 type:complete len:348 (+) Transcript_22962:495-1538(+)